LWRSPTAERVCVFAAILIAAFSLFELALNDAGFASINRLETRLSKQRNPLAFVHDCTTG
jgi:hypothetical protein